MNEQERRIHELRSENNRLESESAKQRELIDHLRSLLDMQTKIGGEEAAIHFERSLYDTAIHLLSRGRFRTMNNELLQYISENSPTISDMLNEFESAAP